MKVTLTYIRLRRLTDFFRLAYFALFITQQMKKSPGFKGFKNTGFGYHHYTMSLWEDESSLKSFSGQGAHLAALKRTKEISPEVRIYTYPADKLPNWKEAKGLVMRHGKLFEF